MSKDNSIYNHCLSEEDMRTLAYQPGTHPREKELLAHVQECELCSDALEGLQLLTESEYTEGMIVISEKIQEKTTDQNVRTLPLRRWYAVAASFAILLSLAYWLNLSLNQKQNEVVQNLPVEEQQKTNNATTLSNNENIKPDADAEKKNTLSDRLTEKPNDFTLPPIKSEEHTSKSVKDDDVVVSDAVTDAVVLDEVKIEQFGQSNNNNNLVPQSTYKDYSNSPTAPIQSQTIQQKDNFFATPQYHEKLNDVRIKEESIKNINTTSHRKENKLKVAPNKPEPSVKKTESDQSQNEDVTLLDSIGAYKTIGSELLLTQAQNEFDKLRYQQSITITNEIVSRSDVHQADALLLKAHSLLKLGKKSDGKKILNDLIKSNSSVKDEAQKLLNAY